MAWLTETGIGRGSWLHIFDIMWLFMVFSEKLWRSFFCFSFQVQQYCLFVSYQLAYKLWLFHVLYQWTFIYVEVRLIGTLEILIFSYFFKFIIIQPTIPNRNPTLAFPSILHFHTIFSFQIPDFLSFQIQFNEVALQINRICSICFPLWDCLQ